MKTRHELNLKATYVSFDDCKPLRALINPTKHWNGWKMPFIHYLDFDKMLADLEGTKSEQNGNVFISYGDHPQPQRVQTDVIDGILWYNMQHFGLCFVERFGNKDSLLSYFKEELEDNIFQNGWRVFFQNGWRVFSDKSLVSNDICPEAKVLLDQSADLFAKALLMESFLCKGEQPTPTPTSKTPIADFIAHATNIVHDFLQDNCDYKDEVHDITIKFGGKTVVVPLNADSFESLEAFLKDREQEEELVNREAEKEAPIPFEWKEAIVTIHGVEDSNHYKALLRHNPKQYWNGWAMPLIHESHLPQILEELSATTTEKTIDSTHPQHGDGNEPSRELCIDFEYLKADEHDVEDYIIWKSTHNGETYYDFGYLGLCFQQVPAHSLRYAKTFIVTDNKGRTNIPFVATNTQILKHWDLCEVDEHEDSIEHFVDTCNVGEVWESDDQTVECTDIQPMYFVPSQDEQITDPRPWIADAEEKETISFTTQRGEFIEVKEDVSHLPKAIIHQSGSVPIPFLKESNQRLNETYTIREILLHIHANSFKRDGNTVSEFDHSMFNDIAHYLQQFNEANEDPTKKIIETNSLFIDITDHLSTQP